MSAAPSSSFKDLLEEEEEDENAFLWPVTLLSYSDMLHENASLRSFHHRFSYSVIHGLRLNNGRWWKKKHLTLLFLPFSLPSLS